MLNSLLSQKKKAILERWQKLVLESYPDDTASFFKKESDRFNNPVGFTISHDLGKLFDKLLEEMDRDEFNSDEFVSLMEYFIKIRSVQGFKPSHAVSFVFQLKSAIRETLADEIREGNACGELCRFESRLDEVGLLAFDSYMESREKIFDLRTRQIKAGRERLLRKAGMSMDEKNEKDQRNGET